MLRTDPIRWSALPLVLVLALAAGCSDDDDDGPTAPDPTGFSEGTVEAGGAFVTSLDASGDATFVGFSFADRTITRDLGVTGGAWDVAFQRVAIKLNGGASGGGEVEGTSLGAVDFASVGAEDVPAEDSEDWQSDSIDYFLDNWYEYDFMTHQVTLTRNVYSMRDASGEHWVKFRVDAIEGATGPGSMGTVTLSYFFQQDAGSTDLSGAVQTAEIEVGNGAGYFDFSSGTQVTPADPAASLEWDIVLSNFTLGLNSGPNGSGECAAFWAFTELDDPTDIEGFTAQPTGAPVFTDIPGSVLTDWYDYNGQTHEISSKDAVYLIQTGGRVYKMQIQSYYGDVDGQPASAHYSFRWDEIE